MAESILSTRENAIIYLAAQGKPNSEIAEALGLSPHTVGNTVREERIQFEIRRLRHRLFGSDTKVAKKKFDEMVGSAQKVIEDILENPNTTVKPQLKFMAAQEVLDRSLGKPKQSVEVTGSLIEQLFDRLDQPEVNKIIDVSPIVDELPALLGEQTELEAKEKNAVDSFVERHL